MTLPWRNARQTSSNEYLADVSPYILWEVNLDPSPPYQHRTLSRTCSWQHWIDKAVRLTIDLLVLRLVSMTMTMASNKTTSKLLELSFGV